MSADDELDLETLDQLLCDAEQGWALSTEARMALAAEVRRLRLRIGRVMLLAGHESTLAIDGTRWIEARRVLAAATGNAEVPS